MDGLIDERTTSIKGESAVPTIGVVRGSALPFHVSAGEGQATQAPSIDRGFDRASTFAETRLENRH